ncbi:MAG: hypothetical protein IH627_10005 [Rubrivivax sp.]|nr:hypothetical protein [Rubrivivax sp.]
MPQFIAHFLELLAAHILAGLFLSAAGAVLIVRLWEPAKRYWRARSWLNRAVSVGVRNFFPSRESYSTDRSLAFVDYIRSAKHELTYFGHWLAFTVEQHNTLETLVDHAKSGVHIRLVLLHEALSPDVLSTYARYFGEDEPKLRAEIAETWRRVRLAQRQLGASEQSRFELRAHREFIPYSAFWFDPRHEGEHILIDMKLFASPRRHAYGIELHPQPSTSSRYPSLFERYADSLRRLQDLSGSPQASAS